jgi:hypothetical protein
MTKLLDIAAGLSKKRATVEELQTAVADVTALEAELKDARRDVEHARRRLEAFEKLGDGRYQVEWTHVIPGLGLLPMEPLRSAQTGNELAADQAGQVAEAEARVKQLEARIGALLK